MELKKQNTINWELSPTDTNVLKGVAIIGMLCWHVLYCPNPEGIIFSDWIRAIGIWGDVCVSAFLFASGYGLSVKFEKVKDGEWGGASLRFVIRRLLRFYSGYWVILLIMMPIGIFVFHIPFERENLASTIGLWIKEVLALNGHSSYNASWWFNALILSLYLLFPLLYFGIKKACIPTIIATFLINGLSLSHINMDLCNYIFIFTIGIALASHRHSLSILLQSIPLWLITGSGLLMVIIPMVILPITDSGAIFYTGLRWYAIFTLGITIMIVLTRRIRYVGSILGNLGTHSANIYLMHTLLFYYWFSRQFYAIGNPLVEVFVLLVGCWVISFVIEKVKRWTGYNDMWKKIIVKI